MKGTPPKNRIESWTVPSLARSFEQSLERSLKRLQAHNRERLMDMLPIMFGVLALGALLLGLIHVLRLGSSRKHIST